MERLSLIHILPLDDCVPQDAHTTETFDAERLNRLVK